MYEWAKVLHIVAVISWMAGLLYLPRLFIYHAQSEVGSEQSEVFKIMERRLYRVIMGPAMLIAWVAGLYLAYITEAYVQAWFICKFFLVILMSAFHGFQNVWRKELEEDNRHRTTKFFRIANEVPTVLMILIVILVVVQPF